MSISEIARELKKVDVLRKEVEARRSFLRDEFFNEATGHVRTSSLPRKVVVIENSFWARAELNETHFFVTRYPSWRVVERKSNEVEATYILERDPSFVPWSFTDEETNIVVARQIVEATPEIDWVTLHKDRPDIFDRISRPKVIIELDEEGFGKATEEFPELPEVISRHLKVKPPVKKLAPIREETEE